MFTLLVGRSLGAAVTGEYQLYSNWTVATATVVALGLPVIALRVYSVGEQNHLLAPSQLLRSARLIVGFGLLLVLLAVGFNGWLTQSVLGAAGTPWILPTAAASGTLLALIRVYVETLKAKGRANLGLFLEYGLISGLLLFLSTVLIFGGGNATAAELAAINVAAMLFAFTVSVSFVGREHRAIAAQVPLRFVPKVYGITLLNAFLPFIPYLVLPHVATSVEVGQFAVSQRTVAIASILLVAMGAFFSPRFAALHAASSTHALAREYRRSQVISVALYAPLALFMLFSPGVILSAFGAEFPAAALLLRVMAVGQLVNAFTGLSSEFLVMGGLERLDFVSVGIGGVTCLVIALVFGYLWGATGVAVAFGAAIAVRNGIAFAFVRRHLGGLAREA